MAKFAFRDAARTQMVYAVEAKQEDNEIWYYCPNPECNAHLYVSSKDGVRVPYFRAKYSRYGHTKGCKYGPDKDHRIDLAKYNEAAFDFESAINSMEQLLAPTRRKLYPGRHKEGKSTGRSAIRTIKDIYSMCKEIGVGGEYNGIAIESMLVDKHSYKYYYRGVYGSKIIECTAPPFFYNQKKLQIFLYPSSYKLRYRIIIQFLDSELFSKIRDIIYNNRDNYYFIVAGSWDKFENQGDGKVAYGATIFSEKQFDNLPLSDLK